MSLQLQDPIHISILWQLVHSLLYVALKKLHEIIHYLQMSLEVVVVFFKLLNFLLDCIFKKLGELLLNFSL